MAPACLILAVAATVAMQPARADLGAALRRRSPPAAALPAVAPLAAGTSVAVPLQRVGSWGQGAATEGNFYVGVISVGQPAQEFRVVFDTSSGHVLLPHRACQSAACTAHRRYSPWESSTAIDVNIHGGAVQAGRRFASGNGTRDEATIGFTQSDLGEGEAHAVLVRDGVCLGAGSAHAACVDVALLAATRLDDAPFQAMPSDGIIGLGLEALSTSPIFSFFGRLLEGAGTGVLPQFGISLGAEGGEIRFGGHDSARLGAPLQWFPVDHPEDGFWQIAILGVRVGGVTVDDCSRGCHGVVDTSVSRLGVQAANLPALSKALVSGPASGGVCVGPELSFDLGALVVELQPQDYADADCEPQLGALSLEAPRFRGVYAFGEAVLRRYYVAFDWERRQVGLAPAAVSSGGRASAPPTAKGPVPEHLSGAVLV